MCEIYESQKKCSEVRFHILLEANFVSLHLSQFKQFFVVENL